MDTERLREFCGSLPIFPLPRAVLLPGAALPLHIFEDRYRALVSHCLDGPGLMGIATLRVDTDAPLEGAEIWPEIGVGQVVAHQPFPDGRCNIILQSVGRAILAEELPSPHPFRLVRGEVPDLEERGVGPALAALKVLVLQIGGLSPNAADEARRLAQLDGMDLVDALAHRLLEDPDEQRLYLGALRLIDRVTQVQDRLASFLVPTSPAGES
jgi:uncharacterized protein